MAQPAESMTPQPIQHAAKEGLQKVRSTCIGNGRNDRLMVGEAAAGIAIIGEEGASAETVQNADVVCRSASEALSLLVSPRRLVATLRS